MNHFTTVLYRPQVTLVVCIAQSVRCVCSYDNFQTKWLLPMHIIFKMVQLHPLSALLLRLRFGFRWQYCVRLQSIFTYLLTWQKLGYVKFAGLRHGSEFKVAGGKIWLKWSVGATSNGNFLRRPLHNYIEYCEDFACSKLYPATSLMPAYCTYIA